MELSIRMKAVAELVTEGSRLADVGTDHGYVPVYLAQRGIITKGIAMDVRPGPLSHAQANIEKYGCGDCIETRLSDGLQKLKENEADSVVIAGMGGILMVRILEEGRQVLTSVKECILQPQSDVSLVRAFLHANDFRIIQENMVIDDGKYYVMMKAVHGADDIYDSVDDRYGRLLMAQGHPVLRKYLEKEQQHLQIIMKNLDKQTSEKSEKRLGELKHTYEQLCEAMKRMRDV